MLEAVFRSFLYVVKFDLDKVRLKPMQSLVSPFTVCDLQVDHLGGLQGYCVLFALHVLCCQLIFVDHSLF